MLGVPYGYIALAKVSKLLQTKSDFDLWLGQQSQYHAQCTCVKTLFWIRKKANVLAHVKNEQFPLQQSLLTKKQHYTALFKYSITFCQRDPFYSQLTLWWHHYLFLFEHHLSTWKFVGKNWHLKQTRPTVIYRWQSQGRSPSYLCPWRRQSC